MYEGLIEDWPEKVCYGRRSVSRLPSPISALVRRSECVICGRTIVSCGMLDSVTAAFGSGLAEVFDTMPAHTPHTVVEDAAVEFPRSGADDATS